MAKKISDVIPERNIGGHKCTTCANPTWVRLIQEVLDQIITGDISPNTTSSQIHSALQNRYEDLACDRYPYKVSTLAQHIRNHETDRWHDLQKIRC